MSEICVVGVSEGVVGVCGGCVSHARVRGGGGNEMYYSHVYLNAHRYYLSVTHNDTDDLTELYEKLLQEPRVKEALRKESEMRTERKRCHLTDQHVSAAQPRASVLEALDDNRSRSAGASAHNEIMMAASDLHESQH